MYNVIDLSKITGFEWDGGNIDKSYQKHRVTTNEAEVVFTDENIGIEKDVKYQGKEERYIAIGKTVGAKILFVVFTLRETRIRIISARTANKKEKRLYEKAKENP